MRDRDAEKLLVKERVSITDLVRETVADLEQRGNELWGCCPFHAEDTPSFHVRPALGVYKCFGCGEAGDIFSFIQKTRGVGFREALEILAERAGVELGSLTPEERRRSAEAREQREVLATALDVFRKAMGKSGRHALEYLQGRGFTRETLLAWDVGFIPGDFITALRGARLSQGQIDGAGFTRAFGDRVGFGIRDGHGALVGFGARLLGDKDGPKYVNTRETPRFNKGRLLYGLHKASAALARTRRLVVMEGYTDVMMAHQAGLDEAVATMGTSFTADHLELVTSRVANLVLVFDGDEAGERAAERAVNMLLEQGRECRVLLLPEGQDPCDWFASHGREEFEALLGSEGLSSVAFLARRGLSRLDAGQPGGREAVAREVLAATGRLGDPLRREGVLGEIARVCGVDRNILRRSSSAGMAAPTFEAPPDAVGRGRGGRPVQARVRTQFVAVAGLAEDVGGDALHRGAMRRPVEREGMEVRIGAVHGARPYACPTTPRTDEPNRRIWSPRSSPRRSGPQR